MSEPDITPERLAEILESIERGDSWDRTTVELARSLAKARRERDAALDRHCGPESAEEREVREAKDAVVAVSMDSRHTTVRELLVRLKEATERLQAAEKAHAVGSGARKG